MLKKLLRKSILGVGAAVMMLGAMAIGAEAKDVNANMYIPKKENSAGLYQLDAYFTSTVIPPKEAVTDLNATAITQADGSVIVSIPVPNTGLSLRSIGTINDSGVELLEDSCTTGEEKTCENHVGDRYYYVAFKLSADVAAEGTVAFTISDCSAHAKVTALEILGLSSEVCKFSF